MMIDTVRSFLSSNRWLIEPFGDDTAIGSSYQGRNGNWPLMIETDEDSGLLICRSGIPILIPPAHRPQVGLLIGRINYELLVGNFELDMNDGDLRFRSSMRSWKSDISAEDCALLLVSHVNTVDDFLPALRAAAQGADADAALARFDDTDDD
jgi:hypothetical protein